MADLAAFRGCMHKLIRTSKLAAVDKLEQMLQAQMLEQHATWKRYADFDRIDIIAERHEKTLRCLYAGFDPDPFYIGLRNTRRQPTPEEFTVDMKANMKRLRLKFLRLQPPP